MRKKSSKRCILTFIITSMLFAAMPLAVWAQSDLNNGDWNQKNVTLYNTAEAELMVRVGDIDNVGYGFEEGYNPFTAEETSSHDFPWDPNLEDPDGTDRIMMGTFYKGESLDGYSDRWFSDPEGTTTRPIYMEYDASGIEVKNALLQMYIDDFQAPSWGSNFTVTLNGKDAPFISELISCVDQTGPTAYIVSAQIPASFLEDIKSGELSIFIDETTGVGDGFAVDFVKLLINYNPSSYVGTIIGTIVDDNGPVSNATINILGTGNTVKTDADGNYTAEVTAGLNVIHIYKAGYIETYYSGVIPSGELIDLGELYLPQEQECD